MLTFTFKNEALTVGETYYFQVRGRNTNENVSGWSATASGFQLGPSPQMLANVTATAGDTEVTLTWAAPPVDDSVVNYAYGQSDPNNPWSWQSFSTNTNSYVVTGLTNGVLYSFQVRARNLQGDGPVSESVTAIPVGPPEAPQDLRAQETSATGTKVKLRWVDAEDPAITHYQYRQKSGEAAYILWTDISNIDKANADQPTPEHAGGDVTLPTSYVVTGLDSSGITYTFQVRAVSAVGGSDPAEVEATPTTTVTAPAQMSNVAYTVTGVTSGSSGTVTFTWDNPEDTTITGYQYRYDGQTSDSDLWGLDWAAIPGDSATATATSSFPLPTSSAIVFFEFRAVNSTNSLNILNGLATAVMVSRENTPTPPATPAPAPPTDLTVTAPSGQVVLSWTDPADTSISKYQFRITGSYDDADNPQWPLNASDEEIWTDIAPSSATTVTHTITALHDNAALTDGTAYTVELRAVNTQGNGGSARVGPVRPGQPDPPTGLKHTDSGDISGSPTHPDLTWSPPAAGPTVTGYQYRHRISGDTGWSDWADTPYSPPTVDGTLPPEGAPGLAAGTTYNFQMRSMTGTDPDHIPSEPSNTVTIKTADPTSPPAPPTGLRAIGGDEEVTLKWIPSSIEVEGVLQPDTSVVGYVYLQSTDGGVNFSEHRLNVEQAAAASLTMYPVTGLVNGQEYTFTLKSQNSADQRSEASDPATASPFILTMPPVVMPPDPPRVLVQIPDQGLTEGESYSLDLSLFFEGNNLLYTATSSDRQVVTADVDGRTLTLTAVVAGTARIAVWARDGGTELAAAQTLEARVYNTGIPFVAPFGGGAVIELFGTSDDTVVGHGRIIPKAGEPTPSGLSMISLTANGILVSEASVPNTAEIRAGYIYTRIESMTSAASRVPGTSGPLGSQAELNTGIALSNQSTRDAVISFHFTDMFRADFGHGSFTLERAHQIAVFLDQPPFNAPSDFEGTFSFTSSVPVSVISLRCALNERGDFLFTALPVAASDGGIQGLLPMFAAGGGWSTELILTNRSATLQTGTVRIFGPGGEDAPLPDVSLDGDPVAVWEYSILARSTVRLDIRSSSSTTQVGSAVIAPHIIVHSIGLRPSSRSCRSAAAVSSSMKQ